jgi:hypothetical protein|tara:strand:+ start:447 stop:668 length:222 start_codon:yes stop_codon:yes gene_type:complete
MDYQEAFNLALGGAAFLGGFLVNKIWAAIERLDNDVRDLPKVYVAKEDYKSDIHDIKAMLRQIFDKLELKADK